MKLKEVYMLSIKLVVTLILLASPLSLSAQGSDDKPSETLLKASTQTGSKKSGWFYGAFFSSQSFPYKGLKNETKALPIIGYKGSRFSLLGPQASYLLNQEADLQFFVQLTFKSAGFKTNDSNELTGISTRSGSLFGGFSINKKIDRLSLNISYLHDLQNRSGGQDIKLSSTYFHNIGPFFIKPSLALNYWDSAYTEYYFGVKKEESRYNRRPYTPSDSFSPSVGLSLATPIFFQGFTSVSLSQHWLDSSIRQSPIINNSHYWKINVSFTRFF